MYRFYPRLWPRCLRNSMKSRDIENRRAFLRKVVGASILTPLALALNTVSNDATVRRYIDVHTHITQKWGEKPALSAGELIRWMDKSEIGKAFVLPLVSPESWDHLIATEYVLRETEPF